MISKFLNVISAVLSAVIIIGLFTFAKVCGGMEGMPCQTTKTYAIAASVVVIIIAALNIAVLKGKVHIVSSIIGALTGLVITLLPGVIAPVCSMEMMHCVSVTKPFLTFAGIVLIIVFAVDSASQVLSSGKN